MLGFVLSLASLQQRLHVFDLWCFYSPLSFCVTAQQAEDHPGAKGSRALWLTNKNYVCTVGFGKSKCVAAFVIAFLLSSNILDSERLIALYDPRNMSKRMSQLSIDVSSSSLLPFYDADNNVLFLGGKVGVVFFS